MKEANGSLDILFATDGSSAASAASDVLGMLEMPPKTRVLVVTAIREAYRPKSLRHPDALDRIMAQVYLEEREAAIRLLRQAKNSLLKTSLSGKGVSLDTGILEGNVACEIVAAARTLNIDLIVVGSRGLSGILAILLGSVARRVTQDSSCPVLVARPTKRGLRRVLVAVDGSTHSREAVRVLTEFPLPAEAEVSVLSVAQPIRLAISELVPVFRSKARQGIAEVERAEIEIAEKLAEEAKQSLQEVGRRAESLVLKGDPPQMIIRIARKINADLIVVGSRGLTGAKAFLLGSVAQKVLEHAPCSVLVVKQTP